MLLNWISYL